MLVEAQFQSLGGVGNFYQTLMPTLPAGVPVPRQTDELTLEDAFQTEHILEQSTENRALQSDFIAVSQSDQVTDPIQPTSFLTNCSTMLQTSHSHSGATISLNDALCTGQAQYTDLLFVKRSGQQWILEVTQRHLLKVSGIDRVPAVRILFQFSETGSNV